MTGPTINNQGCVRSPRLKLSAHPATSNSSGSASPKALSTPSSHPVETTSNPRTEFYTKFKHEADEHDNDFTKKYGGDLDITLIFVRISLIYFSPHV